MTGTVLVRPPGWAAAAGLAGPLADLVALGREWARPRLISADPPRDAPSVQFPGLAGVLPGFGPFDPVRLGSGRRDPRGKRPTGRARPTRRPPSATSARSGRSCGSIRWPGSSAAGLGDRPFGVWASRAWPALADAVLAEAAVPGPEVVTPGRRVATCPARLGFAA